MLKFHVAFGHFKVGHGTPWHNLSLPVVSIGDDRVHCELGDIAPGTGQSMSKRKG
jgi:hypothetical protein